MEQFDQDDKLIENSKDKKGKKASNSLYLLIGVCCLVALCAILCLFKIVKTSCPNSVDDPSKL